MKLASRYTDIAESFAIADRPSPVTQPSLLLFNEAVAKQLSIDIPPTKRATLLSGNHIHEAVEPIALGYSGHQFGHFSPRLGDGRAHLLGAVVDNKGLLWDIQLKGSGATPFSRGGDGRCAIGPAVREYIMSEAMHGLGIPTTRCLAVVASGETVYRQPPQPGAIVTRVATSHIRVGSFQYLATQGDVAGLKKLADVAIARHYPCITSSGPERYLAFLAAVIDKQIELVVNWMRVGFIHGVMNTDNTLISGETIDYGPCAMMNHFDFDTVFSSIDRQGRYALGNQPNIANWNCARLAESLMPLINDDDDQAVTLLSPLINGFAEKFNGAFTAMWAQKLGLDGHEPQDGELVAQLLVLLKDHSLDYTNTFDALTESLKGNAEIPTPLTQWSTLWLQRTTVGSYEAMRKTNPKLIPRNHIIEKILKDFAESHQSPILNEYLKALQSPYTQCVNESWSHPPLDESGYHTFCGT